MTQHLVCAPLFAELNRSALEISVILLELALEPRQKRERVSSRSSKTGQNLIVVEPADLSCACFHDGFAHGHLPVSRKRNASIFPYEQHRSAAHPIVLFLHSSLTETIGTRLNVSQGRFSRR